MKKDWKIIVKNENENIVDSFVVKAENNLKALLNGQQVFIKKHKDYKVVDCGMWIDKDTCQRDLFVEVGAMKLERYFSVEIIK